MVVSKAAIELEHCKRLDPQLDFSKASQELKEIKGSLSPRAADALWSDRAASIEMAARIYRVFNVFVDMASIEYKGGCHRHAIASLKLALETREILPPKAVSDFVAFCQNDPKACQLDLYRTNKAMEARTLRKELKFFQQASSKLRVLCAKMLLQLGGEADVEKAGKLFGEAIEIGLQSCRVS